MNMKDTEINELFDMVTLFVQRGSIPIRTAEVKDLIFTYEQIADEYNELTEAYDNNDKLEVLDAYIDIMYFCISCSIIFQLDTYQALNKSLPIHMPHLFDLVDSLEDAFSKNNVSKFTTTIAQIITYCYNEIEAYNINPIEAFKEVHAANMRKYVKDAGSCIIAAQQLSKKHKNIDWAKNKDGWYCIFAHNGNTKRIFKPAGWTGPQLAKFFNS